MKPGLGDGTAHWADLRGPPPFGLWWEGPQTSLLTEPWSWTALDADLAGACLWVWRVRQDSSSVWAPEVSSLRVGGWLTWWDSYLAIFFCFNPFSRLEKRTLFWAHLSLCHSPFLPPPTLTTRFEGS